MRKLHIGLLLSFVLCLSVLPAFAEGLAKGAAEVAGETAVEETVQSTAEETDPAQTTEEPSTEPQVPFACWLTCQVGEAQVKVQPTQYGDSLFLPTYADLSGLQVAGCGQWQDRPLTLTAGDASLTVAPGETFDLNALFPEGPDAEGVYWLSVSVGDPSDERTLRIRQSANQASLFIRSADPENRGRAYVDGLEDPKSDPITDAALLMVSENGEVVYDNELRELRGRGNTTWGWGIKKPYQIKLEKKTDLLQSDDPANKERTWLLLAESFDATLVHNMLSLDLGRALGMEGTVEYRPVDLYYDGVYNGFYLLCEKVHVKPGRLNILEMDDLIEEQYPLVGNESLFPVMEEKTDIGKIRYVSGVETVFGQQGAYLIELDSYGGFDEESMFQIGKHYMYEIRSPEHTSREDVVYVQLLTNDLHLTIENGGVHPVDGRPLAELIDIDSLARYLLIQQFAKTADFGYTSTYLYLPEGSTQFKAGPLWDFDIAYAMRDDRPHEGGIDGYVAGDRWVYAIMDIPVVQEAMQQIWWEELEPLITGTVLAEDVQEQGTLLSLEGYKTATEASRRMNYDLWQLGGSYNNINKETLYETFDENWDYFSSYIKDRTEWLNDDIPLWSGSVIEKAALHVSYINADVPGTAQIVPASVLQRTVVSDAAWSSQPDEDRPWRAIYTVDVVLTAKEGSTFSQEAEAAINGQPAQVLAVSDTEMTVRFAFSAPVYEPAVYDDVDYGLLYNYHYYIDQYPELLDECGDDPTAILENYVYYDLPSGISAIETFDYDLYYEAYTPVLEEYFFSDTYESTMYYLDNDQDELMLGMGERIVPEAEDFVECDAQ